ncbi:hypothetical protein [Stappia sp.]|uniref:hypothetical protein n=1 Tax=Stappia sp. TaxID=1870903 RepID=UPI003A994A9C
MGRSLSRLGALVSAALFSLVFFGTGLVGAETVEHRLAGPWRLSDEVSGASCALYLHAEQAKGTTPTGFFRAEVTSCGAGLASGMASLAWRILPQGGMELVASDGALIAAFDVGEREGLSSTAPAGAFLVLLPQAPVELSSLIPGAR